MNNASQLRRSYKKFCDVMKADICLKIRINYEQFVRCMIPPRINFQNLSSQKF